MNASKPFLILQLRPEDDTSDNEFAAILKYGEIDPADTHRLRIEKTGIPELSLDDYAAVIVGGSPFDISTPQDQKQAIQVKIESDFERLFDTIVSRDIPFLGACSGCGLLGSYLGTPISKKFGEPVGGAIVAVTEDGRHDDLLADFPEPDRSAVRTQGSLRSPAAGRYLAAHRRCLPGADVSHRQQRLRNTISPRG